jgi:hypothetical protein
VLPTALHHRLCTRIDPEIFLIAMLQSLFPASPLISAMQRMPCTMQPRLLTPTRLRHISGFPRRCLAFWHIPAPGTRSSQCRLDVCPVSQLVRLHQSG